MTAQKLNTLFGENLKRFRVRKGWSQGRLAEEAGIKRRSIIDYEKGRHLPGCRTIANLAFVLGAEAWRLFYEEGA